MSETVPAVPLAIRSARSSGRAHLDTGARVGGWFTAACGRTLGSPQTLPWSATAPEDRCVACTKLVEATS